MTKFGERLRELRKERNFSQDDLQNEIGYSQSAIARWEANLQTPNIEVLVKVATYFNVSADYLLGLKDY